MEIFNILILTLAYTLGISTLILQITCYLKELEYIETILFTITFILLIVSLSVQQFLPYFHTSEEEWLSLPVSMIMVIFTISIPINIHKERQDKLRSLRNRITLLVGSAILFTVVYLHFTEHPMAIVVITSAHLYVSVAYSMVFVLLTKPEILIRFREKTERILSIGVLVIITTVVIIVTATLSEHSLLFMKQHSSWVLALVCILLSASKIPGDIKKLLDHDSLAMPKENLVAQWNITPREKDVLDLLIMGKTYNEIAASLFISLPTVKTHISSIYTKAGVRNRLELSNAIKQIANI